MLGIQTNLGRPERRAVAHRLIEGRDEKAAIGLEELFDVLAVDCRNVDHHLAGACPGSATGGDHPLEALADMGRQDHLVLVYHGKLIRWHYPTTGGRCDSPPGSPQPAF